MANTRAGDVLTDISGTPYHDVPLDMSIVPKNPSPAVIGLVAAAMGLPAALKGLGTAATGSQIVGSAGASAGLAALTGGDPLKSAIAGGLQQSFTKLPEDLGNLLGANIGQALMAQFITTGGDIGKLNGLMSLFGLQGKQKDIIEQVLAIMALSYLGKEYAEKALNQAEELEAKEKATILSAIDYSEKLMPTPERRDTLFAQGAEIIENEYAKAEDEVKRDFASRGLGGTEAEVGQIRRLASDKMLARIKLESDLIAGEPAQAAAALQARAPYVSQLGQAAAEARQRATEQAMLPMNIAKELYTANQRNPYDDLIALEIAQRLGQQVPGAPASISGGAYVPAGQTMTFPAPMGTPTGYTPTYTPAPVGPTGTPFTEGWGAMEDKYLKGRAMPNYVKTSPSPSNIHVTPFEALAPLWGK